MLSYPIETLILKLFFLVSLIVSPHNFNHLLRPNSKTSQQFALLVNIDIDTNRHHCVQCPARQSSIAISVAAINHKWVDVEGA